MVEPAKKKKMPNVQFKTAWKFPETGGNVLFTLLRLQSPIIRIHGSQRDISSVADHERLDGDEILLSSA
jgi:hypothetical protein